MSTSTFSIVVPTRGRVEALRETLAALLELDYLPSRYEVIVVEDGMDQRAAQTVRELSNYGRTLRYETQRPRGAASARNHGAAVASGEVVLFCDDDIIVERSHLRMHLARREGNGDAIVGGTWDLHPLLLAELRKTSFGRFRIGLEQRFQDEARGEPIGDGCMRVKLLPSTNLALRRELFWDLGGFDESFPGAGAEDQDFSLRARAAGFGLLLDTDIRCLHNDARLDLRSYCAREERSARTMPYLFYNHPAQHRDMPYIRENRPISRTDPPSLVLKKLIKSLLASPPGLATLHLVADLLESKRVPDQILRRLYTALLGLHLYRGFRASWRMIPKASPPRSTFGNRLMPFRG